MHEQGDKDTGRSALLKAMGVVSACGLDVAVSVLIGVLLGHYVDDRFHSAPWGLLVGLFVGLAAGVYTVYLIVAPIVRSL